MKEEKRVLTLDDFEHRVLIAALNEQRTDMLEEDKPTEDIEDLLLKAIDAPTKREKRRRDEER